MVMVWDLWGPPCTQDEIGSGDGMRPVWGCEAVPVNVVDLLEEDAINEMCCVQALKLLISKADEEIGELEKYLRSLQSDLKWAENEECSDMFVSGLQEKVDCLDISLKSMKSAMQEDDRPCSRMSGEPADDLYEVLKKLLLGYYRRKDQTEVEANDDVGHESYLDTKSVDRASDVPLRPLGMENVSDLDKPASDSIEQNVPDDSQRPCIVNGMKEKSDGAQSTYERADTDPEPILSYLAPIISLKDGVTESKLKVDIILGSTALSQKSKVKKEASLCGSLAMDSLRLQNQSSDGASKVNWAGGGNEAAVSSAGAIVSHKMTQEAIRKRKLKSVVASPTKVRRPLAGNSLKKDEEWLLSQIMADNAVWREPLTGKILKEVILSVKSESGQHITFMAADSTFKNAPNIASFAATADALAGIKLPNSDGESIGSVTDSSCVESQSDDRRSSSQGKLDLESLSLVNLKALAKQRKITNYHTLRKSLLVEKITNSFSNDCSDRIEVSSCMDK